MELQPSCKGVASLPQPYCKFPCNSSASIYRRLQYTRTEIVLSIVKYSQIVFTDPQQLAGVCIKFALTSVKVATTLVRDCQRVVDYR